MDKLRFTKEMKIISGFKQSSKDMKQNIYKSERKNARSLKLFKILIQNGKYILEKVENQKIELDNEICAFESQLQELRNFNEVEFDNSHLIYTKLKDATAHKSLGNRKIDGKPFSILNYFNKMKAENDVSELNKNERNFEDNIQALNIISNSKEYKLMNQVLGSCNIKLNDLNNIKNYLNEMLIRNKRKRIDIKINKFEDYS